MARQRELRVLVATDGSRHAQAAITTTLHFPWPLRTRVRVISARKTGAEYRQSILLTALDRGAEKVMDLVRHGLDELSVAPKAGLFDDLLDLGADDDDFFGLGRSSHGVSSFSRVLGPFSGLRWSRDANRPGGVSGKTGCWGPF